MKNFFSNFLGDSPKWFKLTIVGFIIFNFGAYFVVSGMVLGWLFIAQFIFCLAMALKCYPLQSGGLLAIQALVLGLTTTGHPGSDHGVYAEVSNNLEVILLLVFMVAGIYFMKPLLLYIFSKLFKNIKSKVLLSLVFVGMAAILSAFLDALTVTAVLITVGLGFYKVYNDIHLGNFDLNQDGILDRSQMNGETLENFKAFLRSLVMHGVVGTALGGVCTIVGEPQNLLIGAKLGWDFVAFFKAMMYVTLPVFFAGILTTIALEKITFLKKTFGFGQEMPAIVREILEADAEKKDKERTSKQKYALAVQAISAILLIAGLALHIAPVGFIGLGLIVIQTAFIGIIDEHSLGKAFEEALPFTGLLVVFFVIVAMIHDQHLFQPVIAWALGQDLMYQPVIFYAANGGLSMISDNVFVATVYINEVTAAYEAGTITREHYEKLAIAINTGTNLPSVATPNGQAAFLFLLTSALAPKIDLGYGKMAWMALPYTIVLTIVGGLCVFFLI